MMLPQNHDWQITLRDWIASRAASDFECGLPGLTYDESYFASDDDVYRAWVTFENLGRYITKNNGVRIDSCHFLMENIEQEGGIHFKLDEIVEPGALAWLHSWEYPGNPYYESEEVANRALAACMVDMIMTHDKFIESGQASISQAVASAFATWAYVYDVTRTLLDTDEKLAFEYGLSDFFSIIEEQGPTGTQVDMDLPAIIGMWYTSKSVPGQVDRAEIYARALLDRHFRDAGYIDHGGGFDPSYNGISLHYLIWIAHLTDWGFVRDAIHKMYDLKAHLTFPEPGGKVYGPSSFATTNANGSPNDQFWSFGKSVAASYLTDNAAYLRYGYRNQDPWYQPMGLQPVNEMKAQLQSWTDRSNTSTDPAFSTWVTPFDVEMPLWEESMHLEGPQVEWDYYPGDGFYNTIVDEQAASAIYEYDEDFIKQFGDELVVFKQGGFGGAIHTGGLSWWDASEKLPGLSGGVCALWTEKGGLAVLGRNRGYQGSTPDTWSNILSWAVSHVYGFVDGSPLSSARNSNPLRQIVMDDDSAMVAVYGVMHGPEGKSNITFRSTFDISAKGLQVTWRVNQIEDFTTLYHAIPLYMGENAVDAQIRFRVNGLWQLEPGEAEAVSIERNSHCILIEFEEPQLVSLGPVWTTGHQSKSIIQPLVIDIKQSGKVSYMMTGPYVMKPEKA